ncbi:hypothetical protein J6590_014584, partial [Homalodisca vitripennis]
FNKSSMEEWRVDKVDEKFQKWEIRATRLRVIPSPTPPHRCNFLECLILPLPRPRYYVTDNGRLGLPSIRHQSLCRTWLTGSSCSIRARPPTQSYGKKSVQGPFPGEEDRFQNRFLSVVPQLPI